MNEKIMELIKGIGALTEMWIITYKGFTSQGVSREEALMHTREFMKVMCESNFANGQKE